MSTPVAEHRSIQTVFFDLDGTLADTAPDLIDALNRQLQAEGRAPLPSDRVRNHVSQGSAAMVRCGFGEDLSDEEFEYRRQQFLAYYADGVCTYTRLFDGMHEVLASIQTQGLSWGIVTNKPGWLTNPLLAALNLTHVPACVVSGDTTATRKPHPEPLLLASRLAGWPAEACVYLGDDPRDIQAGVAAGMPTLIAGWGYIDPAVHTRNWGADGLLREPLDLLAWLHDRHYAEASLPIVVSPA